MLKLFRYLKSYLALVILLVLVVSGSVWTGLQLPALMADVINNGIVPGDLDYIWKTGVIMLLMALLASALALVANYISARVGTGLARDIRNDFFRAVMRFSVTEIDDFSTASLITRTTNDISTVQQAMVTCLSMALRAPITCILAIGQAVVTASNMTWTIALAIVIILGFTIVLMVTVLPKFGKIQKLTDRLTMITRENLTGLRVVRAFNNEKTEQTKFARVNHESARLNVTVDVILALMSPITSLVFSGLTLGCIWLGISMIPTDINYLGNMMAFVQYATQVVLSFLLLTMLFVILPRASVSAKRVNEVLEKVPKITWKDDTVGKPELAPSVEFSHVNFRYAGAEEDVLKDISFKALAGQTTAFIGSTGSGKSTLVNLIPRFYEATKGQILVNGLDVTSYAEKDLSRRIGYVPQRGKLFSGTVLSNILFGVDKNEIPAHEKQLELARRAAKVAQAEGFIQKMDGGFEARIAQGGTNVSGGQKQRLSIARAIAKNPDIYIFDDAFSALDMKTDKKLRDALKPITQDAVTLIVAQRIGTIRDAEQIIVLDQGAVVGKGTHGELLKKCKVYREIAKSQLSDDEYRREVENA